MDVTLDGATADRITQQTLQQHMAWLQEEIQQPELQDHDRGLYVRLIAAMELLLANYFGA